ncbi:hypothetical protein [Breznakiella homolactica]|uniref:Uncharacterized protein n=1 Tax=Breznakiella homolactica TaxID=2798577 RepID=A0A7T7XP62_9SPIR|nr:hypothetical protein [Breznakiella homolactica]QQO09926.1 hypothetical protein JFL75_03165 [Breznakiella homolactica]
MSSGKEIFTALNKQLGFAPEGMDKKSTYKELISGSVWLYFGIADKKGGPYLGFWVGQITKDLKKTLIKTLADCTNDLSVTDVIADESWIYVSTEGNTVSADTIIEVMKKLRTSIANNPDYADEVSPAKGRGKSAARKIFFWVKTVVVLAVLALLFAAFFPEIAVRDINEFTIREDTELGPVYEKIVEAERAAYGEGRLRSKEMSDAIYNLKWVAFEKEHPIMGGIVNFPPINRFIRTINEGFRFIILVVCTFLVLSLVVGSGLMGTWSKQRTATGKRYHSNGRVDDTYDE